MPRGIPNFSDFSSHNNNYNSPRFRYHSNTLPITYSGSIQFKICVKKPKLLNARRIKKKLQQLVYYLDFQKVDRNSINICVAFEFAGNIYENI